VAQVSIPVWEWDVVANGSQAGMLRYLKRKIAATAI
jgi:hypothetical protein